jgi:PAS domain S-box-containing protein
VRDACGGDEAPSRPDRQPPASGDDGGEAPCSAHVLDQPLQVSDGVLADVLRELADAVVITDADGRITFWNDAATRLFGWPADEAVGQTLDLVVPEHLRDRHWAGYRRAMASGRLAVGDRVLEVPARHRDGRALSIALTVSLVRGPAGARPRGTAAVIRDDTGRWQERTHQRDERAAPGRGPTAVP